LESAAGEAMTTPILQKLDEWQRLEQSATDGPWAYMHYGTEAEIYALHENGLPSTKDFYLYDDTGKRVKPADLAFIAAARTIVPAQIEALRVAVEQLALMAEGEGSEEKVYMQISKYALTRIEAILCGVKG
jgi:hypothetical protein